MNKLNSKNLLETKDTTLNVAVDDINKYSDIASEKNVTIVTVESNSEKVKRTEQISCNAVILAHKPLCADYRSDSGSDSVDSENDSILSDTNGLSSDTEYNSSDDNEAYKNMEKQNIRDTKSELSFVDFPPIEKLKISVPEKECVEIGILTSVVETLVVVESYKGTAALDVDTVLFLDNGKRPLGKIFDVLGPISEPVYTVRFNNQDEIKGNKIEKGLKVYFAPKTEHTSFVFLSEVMKIRGSDASWKDNIEVPLEFQDFSDDEEETRYKNKMSKVSDLRSTDGHSSFQASRKRAFNFENQAVEKASHSPTFKSFGVSSRGKYNNQGTRLSSPSSPGLGRTVSPVAAKNISHRPSGLAFPCNVSSSCNTILNTSQTFFPPRFPRPPFSSFEPLLHVNCDQNFDQTFYRQRMPFPPETYGASWYGPIIVPPFPPPPPPPPPIPSSIPTFTHSVGERADDLQIKGTKNT